MNDVNLTELKTMRRNLSANLKNAGFLQKLGEIYFNLSLGSSTNFTVNEVRLSTIVDWQSHHSCIKFSSASFNLDPTIDSALLILNSLNNVGDYSATINFISQQNLLERFPEEKFTITSVLLHTLAKKGLLFQSAQLLHDVLPEHFNKAQQSLTSADETVQRNFQRLIRVDNTSIFYKEETEDGFLGLCEILLDNFQRERNAQGYLASNIQWDFDYCFDSAVTLHKDGFIRVAMQMYALAFVLDSSEIKAELYSLASLHLMGEHQVAFERMNQFTENHPDQFLAYILASHSCAITNNVTGLELILKKSHTNNINSPFLDLLKGFYIESKGQIEQAIRFYESKAQNSNNEFITNLFNSRIERITYEY